MYLSGSSIIKLLEYVKERYIAIYYSVSLWYDVLLDCNAPFLLNDQSTIITQ